MILGQLLKCSLFVATTSAFVQRYGSSPIKSKIETSSSFKLFAGFGAGTKKSKSKKNNKRKGNQQQQQKPVINKILSNPQDRMNHIAQRIQNIDCTPLIPKSIQNEEIDMEFLSSSVLVVDDLLGPDFIKKMRREADSRLQQNSGKSNNNLMTMTKSESTRWNEETQKIEKYFKEGVMSTQIEGGPEEYEQNPLLVEYVVTLTQHLTQQVNKAIEASSKINNTSDSYECLKLCTKQQTNKLAVCLGNGSKYDKHIDNLGIGLDKRKLTALLYLQPPGSLHQEGDCTITADSKNDENDVEGLGGHFRAFDHPNKGDVRYIAPKSDRLVMFWSDTLVHDVAPSFVRDGGNDDHRWALTVWLLADPEKGVILSTDEEIEKRHFGSG